MDITVFAGLGLVVVLLVAAGGAVLGALALFALRHRQRRQAADDLPEMRRPNRRAP